MNADTARVLLRRAATVRHCLRNGSDRPSRSDCRSGLQDDVAWAVPVMNATVVYFIYRSTRSRGSVTLVPPCPRNDRTRARGRTMQRRPSLPDPARRCGTRQKTIACTGGAAMFLMEGMPRSRRIRAFVRLEGPPVRSDDRSDARRRRALDRTVANPL